MIYDIPVHAAGAVDREVGGCIKRFPFLADGRTDGWAGGRADGRTDGRTDGGVAEMAVRGLKT